MGLYLFGWGDFAVAAPPALGSAANPGHSALQILQQNASVTNGIYWIDPDGYGGVDAFQVYADMVTNGGGWMLALNSYNGSEASTTLITTNTGTVSLYTGHTRALSSYTGQIRHQISSSGGNFDGHYTGSYGSGVLPSTGWTYNVTSNTALLAQNFGQTFAVQPSLGGVSWYGPSGTTPVYATDGIGQGPASSTGYFVWQYSVWIRGSSSLNSGASAWLVAESGNWNDGSNWYSYTTAGVDRSAIFNADGKYTVSLTASASAKALSISDGDVTLALNGYTLSVGSDGVTVGSGASLTLANGTVSTSGTVAIQAAALLQGSGILSGDVTVQGTLAAGATVGGEAGRGGIGHLTVRDDLTLLGTTILEIDGAGLRGTAFDALTIDGTLAYGGDLQVFLSGEFNETFDLFAFGALTAQNFSTVTFFGVDDGQVDLLFDSLTRIWFATGLNNRSYSFNETTGALSSVPEPSALSLLLLGGAALLRLRRIRSSTLARS